MTNNDILRRLRFTFDLSDSKMMKIFSLGGYDATRKEVCDWLKKEDEEIDFINLNDLNFAIFLNGFIEKKRGKKEGERPKPERRLNNNIILRKLKIALNLRDDDILNILQLAGIKISKHELSAFFRNPNQSQYRQCKDQFLRNFLQGVQSKYKAEK